jgi:hypothetical protein
MSGLDEIRRLCYMALLRQRTEKYELAGTLVNALAHHSPQDPGADPSEIADRLVGVLEDDRAEDREWLYDQVSRLTAALEHERRTGTRSIPWKSVDT